MSVLQVLVFCTTARLTQLYAQLCEAIGMPVLEIHSRKSQSHRSVAALLHAFSPTAHCWSKHSPQPICTRVGQMLMDLVHTQGAVAPQDWSTTTEPLPSHVRLVTCWPHFLQYGSVSVVSMDNVSLCRQCISCMQSCSQCSWPPASYKCSSYVVDVIASSTHCWHCPSDAAAASDQCCLVSGSLLQCSRRAWRRAQGG